MQVCVSVVVIAIVYEGSSVFVLVSMYAFQMNESESS